MALALEMKGIQKSFGENPVLDRVDFSLSKGRIRALVGENGAGKSTLMNILGGILPADAGEIFIDGEPCVFHKPKDALDRGIAFIHQELNLINDLKVYENLFISRELKTASGFLDFKRMIEKSRELLNQMGIDLDPEAMVRDLDTSYQQIVEIARALLMEAEIIIMDEPTTSLTSLEIKRVFDLMRNLASQGVALIFISHKLNEVMEVCDSFTVLRDGRKVSEGLIADTSAARLACDMVGHEVRTEKLRSGERTGADLLELHGLSSGTAFQDISFKLKAGEILGITGLLGDGRTELLQCLFGLRPTDSGEILLQGQKLALNSPIRAKNLGIAYVPGKRKENGIVPDLSILENGTLVTLQRFARHGVLSWARQSRAFQALKDKLHIKMNKDKQLITQLSGGNQQKVVLAKWLDAKPCLMLFDNPTQGVDVGSKEEIYDIILALAASGVAVVVASGEATECIRLCDSLMVLYHGRVQGILKGDDMNEQLVMRLATGGELNNKEMEG